MSYQIYSCNCCHRLKNTKDQVMMLFDERISGHFTKVCKLCAEKINETCSRSVMDFLSKLSRDKIHRLREVKA